MTAVRRRRTRKPAVRLDVSEWRELLDDGKVHVARGIVVTDGGSHFEIVEGGADVLVEVELQPSLVRCSARLGGVGGGAGQGFWAIPQVGAEVIVGVPDGDLEAGPVILATESTGQVPDGLGPNTYVICVPAGGQVLVHDGTAADAVALATKADLNVLLKAIVNAVIVAGDGGASLRSTILAALNPPVANWPVGTSVLKGK